MDDTLKVLIPAVLGLVGTLLAALLVHRRWTADRRSNQQADYRRERRDTYKALWNLLEDIHLASRRPDLTDAAFSAHLLRLNAFVLQAEVYLDDEIHPLSNAYAQAVRSLHVKIRQSGNEAAVTASSSTATISPETLALGKEIAAAADRADALRTELKTKVEAALRS